MELWWNILKLALFCLLFLIAGCATNDSNNPLVRFWNDGFIYSEREGKANEECSILASQSYPVVLPDGDNSQWHKLHDECMKKKGY